MARASAASRATAMTGPTASRPSLMPRCRIKASSFLIDGEAVIARDDGTPDFHALRSQRRGHEAVLYAFDLIEHDGDDLRDLPLIERKRRLARADRQGQAARHPVRRASDGRRPDRVRARLPHGAGGHRVEADGCALSQRAVEDVAQVEEPGERGGAAGARGEVAIATPSERSLVPQHHRLGEAYYSPGSRPSRRAKAACSPSP